MFVKMTKPTRGRIIESYPQNGKDYKGYVGRIIGSDPSDYLMEAPWGWIVDVSTMNRSWFEPSLQNKTLWWIHKIDVELLNDACGNCKNGCRSSKKCELYQEGDTS